MRHRFSSLGRLLVASFAWLVAARAGAQLVTSSPFLPVRSAASATAPTAGAPLENHGSIDLAGVGLKVRIYDPNRKIGAWLSVNERDPAIDFVVKKYDSSRGLATVEFNGQTMILPQREAKVTSLGVANFGVPMGGIPMPAAVTQAAVLNPTPADEQRRLEAVAQEVARRRQLREQAPEQSPQGGPVAQPANAPQSPNVEQPRSPADAAARDAGRGRAP